MAADGTLNDRGERIRRGGRILLILLPGLLVPSCWTVFHFGARFLGPAAGYLAGFVFYWLIWCLGVPLALLGRRGLIGLFTEERPLFGRANALPAALLVSTSLVTLVLCTLPALGTADWGAVSGPPAPDRAQRRAGGGPLARALRAGFSG